MSRKFVSCFRFTQKVYLLFIVFILQSDVSELFLFAVVLLKKIVLFLVHREPDESELSREPERQAVCLRFYRQ